ncbi:glycoside hydrolase family 127 protein [Flindersiella endophytica]
MGTPETSHSEPTEQTRGPAVPTAGSKAVQRPLGLDDVRITGGPLGRWQRVNRESSIPLGLEQMEKAGSLPNLRMAAGEADGEFQGYRFQDSDLYKQLEAVAWEQGREPSDELAQFVTDAAKVLTKAQQPDGYLNSHYQMVKPDKRYEELEYSHEMYCAGHLFQAAVANARIGGDEGLTTVAKRFADHLVDVFLKGGNPGIDGHPEVETALVELYRVTGERTYLELAEKLVNNRGKGTITSSGMGKHYLQDHLPVREADTAVGHAVRQLYLDAGVVDVYLETGDESLLNSSIERWEDTVATKTYVTGGQGSRHARESFGDRYELPPDRAYNETCAAIASIHWSWRLLLATGESKYADLIERTLYNGFAGSTSADGTRFFYVNPLQRRHDHVEGDDPGRRREWFACACCPPNIMRLVASLGHYVATTAGDTLSIQQYVPGQVSARIAGSPVTLNVETDYPWAGTVAVTVTDSPGEWTLALRKPEWSVNTTVAVNGEQLDATPDEHGYLRVTRDWQPGDTVTLELDLTPRKVYPHQRIDAVRNSVAIERGPLVYCFEQADQPAGIDVEDLVLSQNAALSVREQTDLSEVGPTILIETEAIQLAQPKATGLPYSTTPPSELATTTSTTAVAIPYFQWDNRDGRAMRVWLPLA